MSFFELLDIIPEDPILGLPKIFQEDPTANKVNLGVGTYKTAEDRSYVLMSVREAVHRLLSKDFSCDYLPIDGNPTFIQLTQKLLFGDNSPFLQSNNIVGAQVPGGTAALRMGAELIKSSHSHVFLPEQTWTNHRGIFSHAQFKIETYPY